MTPQSILWDPSVNWEPPSPRTSSGCCTSKSAPEVAKKVQTTKVPLSSLYSPPSSPLGTLLPLPETKQSHSLCWEGNWLQFATSSGPGSGQLRLCLTPLTLDAIFSKHYPPAEACGPSRQKPQTISFHQELASSTISRTHHGLLSISLDNNTQTDKPLLLCSYVLH